MISSKIERTNKIFLIFDIIITIAIYIITHVSISSLLFNQNPDITISRLLRLPWIFPLFIILWSVLLTSFKTYPSAETKSIKELIKPIFKAVIISGGILGLLYFLTKSYIQSRIVFSVFIVLNFFYLLASRSILLKLRKKIHQLNIILVTDGKNRKRIEKLIKDNLSINVKIKEIIPLENKEIFTIKIEDMIRNLEIDWVVYNVNVENFKKLTDSIYICEEMGIPASIIIKPFFDPKISWFKLEEYSGHPMFTYYTTSGRIWALLVKDIIDRSLSIISLVLFSPFLLLISSLIKLTSRGTICFRQKRVGLNGRIFTMYKFRTMKIGSEYEIDKIKTGNIMNSIAFKHPNDPRVTKFGKFLRRFSLDELPQIFNILKGEMSFVGPRPPLPEEETKYKNWQKRKLSMKPGLTCFWQISGRSEITDFDKWIEMDLDYIDNWSLWLDLKILANTIPVIITGRGAY